MADRMESVITRLQVIHTWAEFAREYDLEFLTAKHLEDIAQWADDALELLKKQKAEIQNLRRENHDILTQFHEWAKEQEAVKCGVDADGLPRCGVCGSVQSYGCKFCDNCGRSVKWE